MRSSRLKLLVLMSYRPGQPYAVLALR
uniref:Uncharacterized protein n=1 Tax=Anguilla anguilla TaxID=7936 RepID=A0A0E9THF2_ANGAN